VTEHDEASTGSPTDLMAQWQAAIKDWQESFQALATTSTQQVTNFWKRAAGTEPSEWQARWRAVIDDYATKAKPYQEEMIDALRKLTSSWPDPFKPVGQAMVAAAERGLEAERTLLESMAPMTKKSE
jgi:hypothetical protein